MLMPDNIFLTKNLKRLKTASRNCNLVMPKADKGNLVDIAKKVVYLRLTETILSDLNKFEKVSIRKRILHFSNELFEAI